MTEKISRKKEAASLRELKIRYIIKVVKESDDIRLGELYWFMVGLTKGKR